MSQIYEHDLEQILTSNQDNCISMPAPTRGLIRKIIVKQINGTLEGFTFNLFNRQDACPSVAEISGGSGDEALLDSDLHRICPEVTVIADSDLSSVFDVSHAYQNRDEQDVRRQPRSRIYMSLNPVGSGEKLFHFAYAIEPFDPI